MSKMHVIFCHSELKKTSTNTCPSLVWGNTLPDKEIKPSYMLFEAIKEKKAQ